VSDSLRGGMSTNYDNNSNNSSRILANCRSSELTAAGSAVSGTRATIMDSKYRPNVAEQGRTCGGITRTELTEVSMDRRDAGKDDIVATREVEVCNG